jgi:hypothetical protein
MAFVPHHHEDAEAIARETLADAGLPPAGKQRRPDPCWDELVAVRNRRKSLINQRVRLLNEAEAVLTSLPLTIRAVLPPTSRVRPRLRALDRERPARSRSPRPTGSTSPGWSRRPPTSPASTRGSPSSTSRSRPCWAGSAARSPRSMGSPRPERWSCWSRSATRPASPPRPSSPAGAGQRQWRCPRARATRHPSITGSTWPATGR